MINIKITSARPKETKDLELSALRSILETTDGTDNLYSLSGYSEDRICLEPESDKTCWSVYIATRGRKLKVTSHTSLQDACLDIISRVADSDAMEALMRSRFEMKLMCAKLNASIKVSDANAEKLRLTGYAMRSLSHKTAAKKPSVSCGRVLSRQKQSKKSKKATFADG